MRDPVKGICSVCETNTMVRHFEIFTSGSEGTWLCHDCEMDVCDYIRSIRRNVSRIKQQLWVNAHKKGG